MSALTDFMDELKSGKYDDLIKERAKKWLEEEEYNRWKDTPRFNTFLDILISMVEDDEEYSIDSDYYEYEELFDDRQEFETLCNSLYEFIEKYAKENNIPNDFELTIDDYFVESSYCVKIKNVFYKIQLFIGQGSFIRFERILNQQNIDNKYVIEYEKIKK